MRGQASVHAHRFVHGGQRMVEDVQRLVDLLGAGGQAAAQMRMTLP